MLKVDDISFAYRKGRNVLDGLSFEMDRGDIMCLLGPNGTGKTTLLRCLLGLQHPQGGSICVDDADIAHLRPKERAKVLAYVPQTTGLSFAYEVREVVLMGRLSHLALGAGHSKADEEIALDCLERLGIEHLANRTYQDLSGGEKQMVMCARAMAQQADYLIMDEPTANLDYGNQVRILRMISQLAGQGYGVLMTSHFPDHAFLACSKVGLMKEGRVVASGAPDEVVTSSALSSLYNTEVCVSTADVNGTQTKVCIPVINGVEHKVTDMED